MGSRSIPLLRALLVAATTFVASLLPTTPAAQERSAAGGLMPVKPVKIREVRIEPSPWLHKDQRPSLGVERPVDPFINRPAPQSQSTVNPPHHRQRNDRSRKSFHHSKRGGFGVIGYPVIYPYLYPYGVDPFSPSPVASYTPAPPAPNTYSNVATSPSSDTVAAAPPLASTVECDGSACGGLSFDITPASAQVWVDGVFVGEVDEFGTTSDALLLSPGDHYIELRLAGYRTASFDVTVVSGEITPYRGTLERLRLRRP